MLYDSNSYLYSRGSISITDVSVLLYKLLILHLVYLTIWFLSTLSKSIPNQIDLFYLFHIWKCFVMSYWLIQLCLSSLVANISSIQNKNIWTTVCTEKMHQMCTQEHFRDNSDQTCAKMTRCLFAFVNISQSRHKVSSNVHVVLSVFVKRTMLHGLTKRVH